MATAYCLIDENNVYVGHSDVPSPGSFVAPVPKLKENAQAVWTGRSWKIQKKNINYKSTSIVEVEEVQSFSASNEFEHSDSAFFIDKFEKEKQLLDVEIIKKIENNKKVPKKWNEYSKKLESFIEYSKNNSIDFNEILERVYVDETRELEETFKTSNYESGVFIMTLNFFDETEAKKIFTLEKNDLEILKKYKDAFLERRRVRSPDDAVANDISGFTIEGNTRAVEIFYNKKDLRIVDQNAVDDREKLLSLTEDGIIARTVISPMIPLEIINTQQRNEGDNTDNELPDPILIHEAKSEFEIPYCESNAEVYKNLDLHQLCVRYYEHFNQLYPDQEAPEPTESPEIDTDELQEQAANSALKEEFLSRCYQNYNFHKESYEEEFEEYVKLTGEETYNFLGQEIEIMKFLKEELLVYNEIPTYILMIMNNVYDEPQNQIDEENFSILFEGYQDIESVIAKSKSAEIEKLEKEPAKIPARIQPHMLKGPSTLYETDRK